MAVPGYFLFVLIRSCMLNEIILIRDSEKHTSLYLVLFQIIHGVSPCFVPKRNCAHFCMSAVVHGPAAPWGRSTQKTCMSPLCNRGSAGKTGARRPDGWGDFAAWQMPRGLSILSVWWEVGGAPKPLKGSHSCEPKGPCMASGMCPGRQGWSLRERHLSPSLCQGSSGALQTPASGTHLPSTSLAQLVASSCTSQTTGAWKWRWRMGAAAAWGISGKSGT